MFRIQSTIENHKSYVILENAAKTTSAKIAVEEGGRLSELKVNNVFIIKEIEDFAYANSYASSVLFPFANRIKEGKYTFLGEDYQFEKNENNSNALHGLVFDKTFELFEPEEHQDNCSATFNYYEKERHAAFPYQYFISLTYTLFENELQLRVTVKNMDNKPFPFTLGWHPYFYSDKLSDCVLNFKSDKKVQFDEALITDKIVENPDKENFKIEDKKLDDCYFLADNLVAFSTPKYNLKITSNASKNFLQLYTPNGFPLIAIEPMTGVSDSFNNKIGLQVLEPKETHVISWNLGVTIK
ncbi:aldose 1-epimerase [uncultured Polaribacter sp.]|uniref:aldose 1-epimerase n=1 Tax=uncultured Polaribacter sp. TaxID=174711 RepID=UPI00260576BD|nr:aldose 1-epimerase [uncultured Polaribacter sp.]